MTNSATCIFDNKIFRIILLSVLSFFYLLFFSVTLSPLMNSDELGMDSSMFELMGLAVLKGYIPYVDLFDHKGPLLYFIEAIGQWLIPGKMGLFLLQALSLSIIVNLWFSIAKMFTDYIKSYLCVVLMFFSYHIISIEGNLTEDWSILFITVALYICCKQIQNTTKDSWINYVILGVCFGSVFLIRPNDAVAFVGGPIFGMLLLWVLKEEYNRGLKCIGFSIIGALFIITPFACYFAYYNALPEFWYGLIGYNMNYTDGVVNMVLNCTSINKYVYLPILITTIVLWFGSSHKEYLFVIVPTALLAYLLLGERTYNHYFITWLPCVFLFFWIGVFVTMQGSLKILSVLLFFLMPFFNNRNILKIPYHDIKFISRTLFSETKDEYASTEILFHSVSLQEKDSIWSYNLGWGKEENSFPILWRNQIVPCNRVPLIFMAQIDTTLYQDMDITIAKPLYILYAAKEEPDISFSARDSLFIKENYYMYSKIEKPEVLLYKRGKPF